MKSYADSLGAEDDGGGVGTLETTSSPGKFQAGLGFTSDISLDEYLYLKYNVWNLQ